MINQVWRAVKTRTKSASSGAQARAKVEADIRGIVKRMRASAKAKNKGECLSHRASVTADAEAKERV